MQPWGKSLSLMARGGRCSGVGPPDPVVEGSGKFTDTPMSPMQSKVLLGFLLFGAVGPESLDLGRFPAKPGPGGGLGKARPGPRSIRTDLQPGRPFLRPFREVF